MTNSSKIFEGFVYNQLIRFVQYNNILSPNQYVFQNGKSTENAVTAIVSQILKAKERKNHPTSTFLGFAKACDTVNHDILVKKSNYYGIQDQALEWFKSYLSNRTQFTQIGDTLSDIGYVKHGVPQGSVLGPLLFLIYINDITEASTMLKFYLFADDTTVFYSDKTNPETEALLNLELSKVSDWLAANKLSLNVGKSNFLHFHHGKSRKEILNIMIDDTEVKEKESTKYLGVMMDNKLNWKTHIQITQTKLSKGICILAKTRYFVTDKVMLNLYYSYFQSHLNYNILNLSMANSSSLKPIRNAVKKAVRIMSFKNKYEHTAPLFKKFEILSFDFHVQHKQAVFMWKLSNELILPPISNLFSKNTYNSSKFNLPKSNVSQKAITFSGVKLWNSGITESLKNKSTLKSFSSAYKKALLDSI